MTDIDLVGPQEIAERTNVQVNTVHQWMKRGILPEPNWRISGVPIWYWDTIAQFVEETGRTNRDAHAQPDYVYAPTPQQIIDHLAVGGKVEQQEQTDASWVCAPAGHRDVRRWRGEAEPRMSFRLAPISPAPNAYRTLDALGDEP